MWPELFNLEAFWFWTLIVAQSGLVIWFVRQDQPVAAVLSVLSLLTGIAFFPNQWESLGLGDLHQLGFWWFLRIHIGPILAIAGSYFILGLGWAMCRWWMYVRSIRLVYEGRKEEWLVPRNLLNTSTFFRNQALIATALETQQRYSQWASACASAAAQGGNKLTSDLKPVWKEFVENGYRF